MLGKITDARFMELSQGYEAEDTGNGWKQRIDIYYSFIGKADLPEE